MNQTAAGSSQALQLLYQVASLRNLYWTVLFTIEMLVFTSNLLLISLIVFDKRLYSNNTVSGTSSDPFLFATAHNAMIVDPYRPQPLGHRSSPLHFRDAAHSLLPDRVLQLAPRLPRLPNLAEQRHAADHHVHIPLVLHLVRTLSERR